MAKKALGKGLGALLNTGQKTDSPSQESTHNDIRMLPLDSLEPNPNQPRHEFKQEALEELASSIKEKGVIQPILVEKQSENSFLIVAGERRYRASRLAGLSRVPVIIRSFTEDEKLEIALIENIQREDLTPIEEAKAYKALMDTLELSQEEVAKRLGVSRSMLANTTRLLRLSSAMQEAVSHGELSAGHARAILSLGGEHERESLFSLIRNRGLSVRQAETEAAKLKNKKSAEKNTEAEAKKRDSNLVELENDFMEVFGSRVAIKGTLHGGKIEISYYSMEDLDRIFNIVKPDK